MHGNAASPKDGRRRDYYICTGIQHTKRCDNKSIPKDEIESRVVNALKAIVQQKEVIEEVIEAGNRIKEKEGQDILDRTNLLKSELSKTEQEINRIISAIKATGHSRAMLETLGVLEHKRDDLRSHIAQSESITTSQEKTMSFADWVIVLPKVLDITNEKERSIILRGFVQRIDAERQNKNISGSITLQPDMGEIVLPI